MLNAKGLQNQESKWKPRPVRTLLSDPITTRDLFQYISETRRFSGMRVEGDFTEDEMEKWRKEKEKKRGKGKWKAQIRA